MSRSDTISHHERRGEIGRLPWRTDPGRVSQMRPARSVSTGKLGRKVRPRHGLTGCAACLGRRLPEVVGLGSMRRGLSGIGRPCNHFAGDTLNSVATMHDGVAMLFAETCTSSYKFQNGTEGELPVPLRGLKRSPRVLAILAILARGWLRSRAPFGEGGRDWHSQGRRLMECTAGTYAVPNTNGLKGRPLPMCEL